MEVKVEAKNNISAPSLASLNHSMTVKVDIGDLEVQVHPELTDSGQLVISTNQNFEITVSTSIKQPVKFTFKFCENCSDPILAKNGHTKKTHKYETETNFTVEITASVTGKEKKHSFRVIARACGPPSLFFPDKYTLSDPQVTTKATPSFQLKPRVKYSCNGGKLSFRWNITSLEDIETLSNFKLSDLEKIVFTINPKDLKAGNYRISLNVTYVDPKTVSTSKYSFETYMRVERSSLVAVIRGGSLREIDTNSTEWLTLNAADSFDPDGRDGHSLTFQWQCKFETNPNKSLAGGVSNSSSFVNLTDSRNRSVNFKISQFLENVTYIFNVTIRSKDGRSASATQAVKFIPGIPSLEIR